jgi:hypothetical protein
VKHPLLLGINRFTLPLPRFIWQKQILDNARGASRAFAHLTPQHQQLRSLAVCELARQGRPLSPDWLAGQMQLPVEQIVQLLNDLEKGMTFLYRRDGENVTWAYPFSVDETPHSVQFEGGEKIYAA